MRLYRLLVRLGVPLRWWVRLEVGGAHLLPPAGTPVLVVANHDSMLDPLVIADTLMRAGIPIRFLAMRRLWRWPLVGPIMDALEQIPVRRGAGDPTSVETATQALREGGGVCIFPEGGLSHGQVCRARRGVARIIRSAPQATVLLAAVSGGTDLARFPKRPRVRVDLFVPRAPSEAPLASEAELAASLLQEIRARVPPVAAGRRPAPRVGARAGNIL